MARIARTKRTSHRRHVALASLAASAVLITSAGCATASRTSGVDAEATTATTTATATGKGWIGGAPLLDPSESGTGKTGSSPKSAAGSTTSRAGARGDAALDEAVRAGSSTDAIARPAPAPRAPIANTAPRAGSVDDNVKFDDFTAYLTRVSQAGVPFRPLDPAGRILLQVRDASGNPSSGTEVIVAEGQREITKLRATADGTIRFHPKAYGSGVGPFTFSSGSVTVTAAPGSSVTLMNVTTAAQVSKAPIDLLFLIDATGSMADEIDRLKATVATVVERIESLPGQPDVRLAMTIYRDQGDSFVTRTFDFTNVVGDFQKALSGVVAGGGGDTPEAVDEALDEALAAPSWRQAGQATQLVILIGDAGGHPERQVRRPYTDSLKDAASRGIKIFPVASSSSDDQAEVAFRQMAQFTGSRFVFLTYGVGGAALGPATDITKVDYEELSLEDLVVRLVADELSARTGKSIVVPNVSTTTTSRNQQPK